MDVIRHLKIVLDAETESGRSRLVTDGSAVIRAFIGLDDQMWRDLAEIIIESHGMDWGSVYESGDEGSLDEWDGETELIEIEAPVAQPGPVVEFSGIDRLITQVVNSCNTAGASSIDRVSIKLDELAAEILSFANTYQNAADDMVGTYARLLAMASTISRNSKNYARELYAKFETSRQLKTALNLRKSRINSVIQWVEYPIDPTFIPHRTALIGANPDKFRAWVDSCKYIWLVGIGHANKDLYSSDTGHALYASYDLRSPDAIRHITKPSQLKLVNATMKEWDVFVQQAFNDIYDPEVTSKIVSKMSKYEESVSRLLSDLSSSGKSNWDSELEPKMTPSSLIAKGSQHDFSFKTGFSLDIRAQLSQMMGMASSTGGLSFIFNFPEEWLINAESIKLKLSIAIQSFPRLGNIEVKVNTRSSQNHGTQLVAEVPLTTDEAWLTSLRTFLLEVLDKLISESINK